MLREIQGSKKHLFPVDRMVGNTMQYYQSLAGIYMTLSIPGVNITPPPKGYCGGPQMVKGKILESSRDLKIFQIWISNLVRGVLITLTFSMSAWVLIFTKFWQMLTPGFSGRGGG